MPEYPIKFDDKYEMKEELGRGAFSIVYRCVETKTKKEYAAKVIKKERLTSRDLLKLESEARICRKLDHPNIVRLHRVISEAKLHFFVFDLVTGGELFDDLVTRVDNYTEELAAKCTYQMLDTIKYIHSQGVIHRDLKPENVLLESKDNKIIKIADFGLAVEVEGDEMKWFGLAGTPNYMAPEVLEMKPYGKPVDLWACGVILYIMLAGYQPFYHTDERKLNALIKAGDYELASETWTSVTDEGKDLITKLLCVVPSRRLTAVQALEHQWFKKIKTGSRLHRQETLEKLKRFNAKRKFKAAVHSNMFLQTFLTAKKRDRGSRPSADVSRTVSVASRSTKSIKSTPKRTHK